MFLDRLHAPLPSVTDTFDTPDELTLPHLESMRQHRQPIGGFSFPGCSLRRQLSGVPIGVHRSGFGVQILTIRCLKGGIDKKEKGV